MMLQNYSSIRALSPVTNSNVMSTNVTKPVENLELLLHKESI